MSLKTPMKNYLLIIITSLILMGCSGDPYEKYYGLWERQNVKGADVMKISRDGETILMTDRLLDYKLSVFQNKKEKQENRITTLNQKDGKLSLETGFGGIQFGLSKDENTLRFDNRSYKRIDEARLKEINLEFDRKFEEDQNNKLKCKALREEYKKDRSVITDQYKDYKKIYNGRTNEEIKEYLKVLKLKEKDITDQYVIKEKTINNCNVRGFF